MRRLWLSLILLAGAPLANAAPAFTGVAAGDATTTSAVLWTRVSDAGQPVRVTAQVADDPDFRSVVWSASGESRTDSDFTLKLMAAELRPGTRYWYRFASGAAQSEIGRFTTPPPPNRAVHVRFGFSGDADGRFRPYPLVQDIGEQGLDFFIFLGDTMYESASKGSPAATPVTPCDPPERAAVVLRDYHRKYRENRLGVAEDGTPGSEGPLSLRPLFAATGIYAMPDNHELGNGALQAGGALPDGDCSAVGFNNATVAFLALQKAFFDYHPTRVDITGTPQTGLAVSGPTVEAPVEPRSHGTARQWFAQSWGSQAIYLQTDGRSYRDARLPCPDGAASACPEAGRPDRTMLGVTQYQWLTDTLLHAQQAGTTWKFVAIASPIDETGSNGKPGSKAQDGKSWYGGYRAERDSLLDYITANHIRNVVFLTTDDHQTRVSTLRFNPNFGRPGTITPVPAALQIVAGPLGAGGPDTIATHSFADIRTLASNRDESQRAAGAPPLGLPAGWKGLTGVSRLGAPAGAPHPAPVDFFSPDTFSYAVLDVAETGVLTVETWGICSYPANTFAPSRGEPDEACDPVKPRLLIRFQLDPR